MKFNFGLDIVPTSEPLGFLYGEGIFGPEPKLRKLKDIRANLLEKDCDGPESVYAIAMDVGKNGYKKILTERMLLFGIVTYVAGRGANPCTVRDTYTAYRATAAGRRLIFMKYGAAAR